VFLVVAGAGVEPGAAGSIENMRESNNFGREIRIKDELPPQWGLRKPTGTARKERLRDEID